MDESSTIRQRRSNRSNVLLAASIEAAGKVIDVKLRNLSAEGALIEGQNLPVEGSQVLFRRNELRVKSRVAWVNGKHAGVAFGVPLDAEQVLRNVPKPRPRMIPDFRRPGLGARRLTPEEQKLVESWVWAPTRGSLGE
jgi:hypothetical protein